MRPLRYRTKANPITTSLFLITRSSRDRLTLEGEAGAELVASLVELLRVERTTNTEGQAAVDLGVVSERGNAKVVDLGLYGVSFHD